MQSWHQSKTNKLVAATLISLLTSCGSGGGKASNGNKNPEPTPIDLPKPGNGPGESNAQLITDEKTVSHIESQFSSDSERHVAAVIAAEHLPKQRRQQILKKLLTKRSGISFAMHMLSSQIATKKKSKL
jgi:hypothetical protein